MQQIRIPKSSLLRQVINFLFYCEFEEGDTSGEWLSIFPNVTTNMIICLENKMEFPKGYQDTGVSISCTTIANMRIVSKLRFVQVQFKPFGIHAFKGTPMSDLVNSMLDLEFLFKPSECERIKDRLSSAGNISDMFHYLEIFLEKRLKAVEIDKRLPISIELLNQNHISLDAVSEEVCLTSRGFRKLFTSQVGLSPGYYKKIARFNAAASQISTNPDVSLTTIAVENGYYDQSHFIRDFRQFAGISPKVYQKFLAKSSDFYNYRSSSPHRFEE
ncbi:MAG: AraC family transcriptional regulator [Bacteroidota bacterium]